MNRIECLEKETAWIRENGLTDLFEAAAEMTRVARGDDFPVILVSQEAAMLTCFALGITDIDPLEYHLDYSRIIDWRADFKPILEFLYGSHEGLSVMIDALKRHVGDESRIEAYVPDYEMRKGTMTVQFLAKSADIAGIEFGENFYELCRKNGVMGYEITFTADETVLMHERLAHCSGAGVRACRDCFEEKSVIYMIESLFCNAALLSENMQVMSESATTNGELSEDLEIPGHIGEAVQYGVDCDMNLRIPIFENERFREIWRKAGMPAFDRCNHTTCSDKYYVIRKQIDTIIETYSLACSTYREGYIEQKIDKGGCFCDYFTCREDLYSILLFAGIDAKKAFSITEFVRKGKAAIDPGKLFWQESRELMESHGVGQGIIDICEHALYLPSRSNSVARVVEGLRLIWYKCYAPKAFEAVIKNLDKNLDECVVYGRFGRLRGLWNRRHAQTDGQAIQPD